MPIFEKGKYPRTGQKGVTGGWPDITKVPGDGEVVKPYRSDMPERSAAHSADQTEDIFGVGQAVQRGSPDSRAGKIPAKPNV